MSDYPSFEQEPPITGGPISPQNSPLAIVSLVAGILGWTVFPLFGSIAAVITGHLAKKEIRESAGRLNGDGMATAGVILGYTFLGFVFLIFCAAAAFMIFIIAMSASASSQSVLLPFIF